MCSNMCSKVKLICFAKAVSLPVSHTIMTLYKAVRILALHAANFTLSTLIIFGNPHVDEIGI
jgi:hypothetical protein